MSSSKRVMITGFYFETGRRFLDTLDFGVEVIIVLQGFAEYVVVCFVLFLFYSKV